MLVFGEFGDFEAEGDVIADGEVGEERVVLEHRVHRPLLGRQVGDVLAIQQDAALIRLFETRRHAQQGGLAATGRA